mmetsp:Transcript_8465/g.11142  ORF Transcript_8465/g.11142 Transcript_8465/m.11142 type:complete len:225 (-) Transcript_8465:115-789(-)|eukprot:CAMPEP_0198145480 /NCGR_PEP_ID=MMETSP1443-20131203/23794_1 /TAXON_ID=186043 /ORGANISM="Entomoneis sp., Strain CCMP2396" /LENGTH=224 /DNA_ID=CAMNT_0043809145 /DNA_START=77 /DNA_END=751 /DNA_ORIENTATION=-
MKFSIALSVAALSASSAGAFVVPSSQHQVSRSKISLEAAKGWSVATAVIGWTLAAQISVAQAPMNAQSDLSNVQTYPSTLVALGAYVPEDSFGGKLDLSMPSYDLKSDKPSKPLVVEETDPVKAAAQAAKNQAKAEKKAVEEAKKVKQIVAQQAKAAEKKAAESAKRATKEAALAAALSGEESDVPMSPREKSELQRARNAAIVQQERENKQLEAASRGKTFLF